MIVLSVLSNCPAVYLLCQVRSRHDEQYKSCIIVLKDDVSEALEDHWPHEQIKVKLTVQIMYDLNKRCLCRSTIDFLYLPTTCSLPQKPSGYDHEFVAVVSRVKILERNRHSAVE
ncbi:hypothetical protein TNCV_2915551 [Trichonephila clavipes]|nr:hypothetical protein TNCV_2915551 [Trichonephila clavipes]